MKKKVLALGIKFIIQIMVIAICLIGCSGVNNIPTPEATLTDVPALIPTTTNTPLPPTKTPTHTPIPLTSTPEKPDEYYNQINTELKNNFGRLILSIKAFSGQDTGNPLRDPNYFIDNGSFEIGKLKEYIAQFLELSCHRPEMLEGIEFEPFLLIAENNENLKINVEGCSYTKETLERLEQNGHMITLSHPIFESGVDTSLSNLFPGSMRTSGYDSDGRANNTTFRDLAWYSGMVLGVENHQSFMLSISERFSTLPHVGSSLNFHTIRFKPNILSFSIPTDSNGNMVFSKFMLLPKNVTPDQIEKMITKGTVAHIDLFSNKIWFGSESLSE